MAASFSFQQFSVDNTSGAFPVGTDAVLLGASMTIGGAEKTFLDVGCGTGVISLIVAQRTSGRPVSILGIDADAESAGQAAANYAASPWGAEMYARAVRLQDFACRCDHIFSNPPYFDESLKNPDPRKSAARHTEDLSFREICAFAAENLNEGGVLSLVLPADFERELMRVAGSYGLFPFRILRVSGSWKKKPSRLVAEFSRDRRPVAEERVWLQNGSERSEWYGELTKELYLKK